MVDKKRIEKIVYGMALGDAWGHHLEFQTFKKIKQKETPYPQNPNITDDTQMSLYAMHGINNAQKHIINLNSNTPEVSTKVRVIIAESFLQWLKDPDNNRAPGTACMTALHKLEDRKQEINGFFDRRKLTGIEGTQTNSKGCGANMRNPWFGALPYTHETITELSFIQAEITHSHPLAYSAAALTALLVKDLVEETVIPQKGKPVMLEHLIQLTKTQLTKQWSRDKVTTGFQLALEYLEKIKPAYIKAIQNDNGTDDLCELITSEGWVAEEALMVAVLANELHSDNLLQTLHRAVRTNGDSDSIAAIAGSIAGAYTTNEIPPHYVEALEPRYKQELKEIINIIAAL